MNPLKAIGGAITLTTLIGLCGFLGYDACTAIPSPVAGTVTDKIYIPPTTGGYFNYIHDNQGNITSMYWVDTSTPEEHHLYISTDLHQEDVAVSKSRWMSTKQGDRVILTHHKGSLTGVTWWNDVGTYTLAEKPLDNQ